MKEKRSFHRSKTAIIGEQHKLYGTFKVDSVRGRLLELNTYLNDRRSLIGMCIFCALATALFWSVTWIAGIVMGLVASRNNRKDLTMASLLFFIGTLVGLFLCALPLLLVLIYGLPHFLKLEERMQISTWDFAGLASAQIILMFCFAFCWIYHTVSNEVDLFKQQCLESWQARGTAPLDIPSETVKHMEAHMAVQEEASAGTRLVYAPDLLKVLEALPGWLSISDSDIGDDNTYLAEDTQKSNNFHKTLEDYKREADEAGLWPLDLYTLKSKNTVLTEENMSFFSSLQQNLWMSKFKVGWVAKQFSHFIYSQPLTCVIIVLLATIRVVIPRLWIYFFLNGSFFPHEAIPIFFVCISSLMLWLAFIIWVTLFVAVKNEYTHNGVQATILTALISMEARQNYVNNVLSTKGLPPEQAKELLACLPLLDIRKPENIRGFWRVREFSMLDRINERIGMEVLTEMLLVWLVLMVALAVRDIFWLQKLSAMVPVAMYDIAVFGILVLQALQCALHINHEMAGHGRIFQETLHDVSLTMDIVVAEEEMEHTAAQKKQHNDLKLAERHLQNMERLISDPAAQETFVFGVVVTPKTILSMFFSLCASVFVMWQEVSKLMKGDSAGLGFLALHSAKSFFKTAEPFHQTVNSFLQKASQIIVKA